MQIEGKKMYQYMHPPLFHKMRQHLHFPDGPAIAVIATTKDMSF
jgi:hypothetical protein